MTENKTPTLGPFSRTHVAVCCILAAGTMWGCQGLPSRALAGLGMPALPIMVLRDLGGAALLALLFLLTDRTAFRVRLRDGCARLQFPADQLARALAQYDEIVAALKPDYRAVLLDLEARHA